MPMRTRPAEERFWDKVQITDNCWIWTGALNDSGYGVMGRGGRSGGNVRATHVSWKIHKKEEIQKGIFALHKCDNPICVNPEHLFLGTAKHNYDDMKIKNRNSDPPKLSGELNGYSKLTENQVIEIKSLKGQVKYQDIADLYNVSKSCITAIMTGRNWGNVNV